MALPKLARFTIAGSIATGVTFASLYILADILDIWYLAASIVAFIIGWVASFVLHKFWTFGDSSLTHVSNQAASHFLVAFANLILNTGLMYFFVEHAHIHHLLSQLIVSAGLAGFSFFLYQRYIFRRRGTA